jgi:hypothetical protein
MKTSKALCKAMPWKGLGRWNTFAFWVSVSPTWWRKRQGGLEFSQSAPARWWEVACNGHETDNKELVKKQIKHGHVIHIVERSGDEKQFGKESSGEKT